MSGMGDLGLAIGRGNCSILMGFVNAIVTGLFYCLNNKYSIWGFTAATTFFAVSLAIAGLAYHLDIILWNTFNIRTIILPQLFSLLVYSGIFFFIRYLFLIGNEKYLITGLLVSLFITILLIIGFIIQTPDFHNWYTRKWK